jgi:hypothetical protein
LKPEILKTQPLYNLSRLYTITIFHINSFAYIFIFLLIGITAGCQSVDSHQPELNPLPKLSKQSALTHEPSKMNVIGR